MKKLTYKDLLSRVSLKIPLAAVANQVAKEFSLGRVISFKPMLVGYEELNCLLETSLGRYVIKIFSKNKNLKTIESNVSAIVNFYLGKIPVPKPYKTTSGDYLYKIKHNPKTYLVVMDYFNGSKFTEITPTRKDFLSLTKILAKIHNLSFNTNANYDIWLTAHLLEQFKDKKKYLTKEDYILMKPVINNLRKIDYHKLTKSIVHFDLHRENALKNSEGEYAILDLASCDYSYTVFDLGTFIGLFCFDATKLPSENLRIYSQVLKTYLKQRKLSAYDITILPLTIKGIFAANLLISSYLQKSGKDENPEQTIYYKSLGRNGLKMLARIADFN